MWIDDLVFEKCSNPVVQNFWIPESPIVVLGSSNEASSEVDVEACSRDSVSILKRRGGGGTVLLYNGCVILSLGAWVKRPFHNKLYFELLNQTLLNTLKLFSPVFDTAVQSGISDLSIADRKFCGTSLFRSREFLMFQASLIVNCNYELINRYLKHPSKEPDYRRGRSHESFLVGLDEISNGLTPQILMEFFQGNYDAVFRDVMKEELSEVNFDHLKYLTPKKKT